jgi:hypothetical protein
MFLGHYALGFAAKSAAPKTSLGAITLAANLADEMWPILLLLGVEHVAISPGLMEASPLDFTDYPWTHSLLTGALAGLAFGVVYFLLRRYGRGALVLGGLVLSHWLLDLFFHRADLPLWPGGPKLGLGLWSSLPVTLLCELAFFAAGVWLYQRRTEAIDRTGSIALWALAGFLVVVYLAAMFSPPPPSPGAVAWSALALWLLVPWTWWIDRHRKLRAV